MKPWELYDYQKKVKYNNNIYDYNWQVETDDENKIIYIFTKYSTTWKDWVTNFLFFYIPQVRRWFIYFACMGWQTAFNCCKGMIMNKALTEINKHPDYEVICCGHSYGGAGSVLTGIEVFFQTGVRPSVITFGSPKPLFLLWSKMISKLFFKEVKQYAHRSDLITYLAPFFGYWNVKVVRVGKFSFKALFDVPKTHTSYGDESLYEGVEL